MLEIEVKILEIEEQAIRKKLEAMGAKIAFDGQIRNLYMDTPDEAYKKSDCVVRLRKKGERSLLTFKKRLDQTEAKVCEEHEVEVSDFDEMRAILEAMGLRANLDMYKHRTSYRLKDAQFEIDRYQKPHAGIPVFLEIEAKTLKMVHKYAESLGFDRAQCRPWSTWELIAHYHTYIT